MEDSKVCAACGQLKPLSEYYRDKQIYYRHQCKECDKARVRANYERVRQGRGTQAKPPRLEVVCGICGKSTWRAPSTVAQGGKYCSLACTAQARRRPATLTCVGCGTAIETKTSQAATRKYCSQACLNAHKKTRIQCQMCGKERRVSPTQLQQGARFCSWACSQEWRLRYGPLPTPSQLDQLLYTTLDQLHIPYIAQHRIPEAHTIPDAYLPDRRLVLYADGEYWHSLPSIAARDARQVAALTALGYTVRRLPATDLLRDPVRTVQTALAP
jgi:very-short-patch-repair endonuclease